MTKESLKVLETLKKVQITEDNTVYLKLEEFTARTVVEKGRPFVSVDLSEYSDRLWSILVYLAEQRLIMNLSGDFEYIQVTHEGWCSRQAVRRERQKVLFRSVVLPVVVSLVTTLLTLLLESWLSQIPQ